MSAATVEDKNITGNWMRYDELRKSGFGNHAEWIQALSEQHSGAAMFVFLKALPFTYLLYHRDP